MTEITIKLKELPIIKMGLDELYNNKDMFTITSYKIGKIVKALVPEFELFEKSRKEIFEKYGEQSEENENMLVVKKEMKDKFEEEMASLFEHEIKLNVAKITLKELSNVKISPKALEAIEMFIDETM